MPVKSDWGFGSLDDSPDIDATGPDWKCEFVAVPKRRKSPSSQGMRKSHDFLIAPAFIICPQISTGVPVQVGYPAGHDPTAAVSASVLMWPSWLCGAGPGQTPVPGHAAPAEHHISYRVTEPQGRLSTQRPPSTRLPLARPSTPRLASKLALICRSAPVPRSVGPVTRVQPSTGRFESARKELCGVPDREKKSIWIRTAVMWSTT
jgi:hypothetical protein